MLRNVSGSNTAILIGIKPRFLRRELYPTLSHRRLTKRVLPVMLRIWGRSGPNPNVKRDHLRSARRAGLRQVRHDHAPLSVGQIGLVSRDGAAMLLSSGWRPHGEGWLEKPLGITAGRRDSTLFKNCR
jgi:hypothetical protein